MNRTEAFEADEMMRRSEFDGAYWDVDDDDPQPDDDDDSADLDANANRKHPLDSGPYYDSRKW